VGWLAIEAVEPIELNALRDADALADGFASLRELRRVLLELYPEHAQDGKRWFRVEFRLSREVAPAPSAAPDPQQRTLFE
jgi:hypothetical protein